jgi:hypothetical protein
VPASRLAAALLAALVPALLVAQQPIDSAYTAKIRELTPTHDRWKFTTELVDHLPESDVPTPLDVLGYVPGTIGRLSYVADVNKYFRALDEASPRVRVITIGESDEGREMIAAMIADEAALDSLDDYKAMAARLADPRGLSANERVRLIREAKPIYWLAGAMHSPETGSPEMLMELAYRLAVGESEHLRSIRANVITMITPVQELDGRDRMVDVNTMSRDLGLGPQAISLVYWGKYTAHDNNRDGMVVSQKLTKDFMKTFLEWHPTVTHDLHESVPFLYTSTGTGPYNDEFDPIVVDEWHALAYQEIMELTRRGLPGVWTHGFYDGWAPNYMLSIANLHNSIGRFYETYTSGGADCHTVNLPERSTDRVWYRPNPPVNGVKWCIRSNINYSQSGVLIALKYVGEHRETFMENFVAKGERMIARGTRSAPYAYVIPSDQRHAGEAADLVNLFRAQGSEVHRATAERQVAVLGESGRSERPMANAPRPDSAAPPGADSARTDSAGAKKDSTRKMITVRPGDWIVRLDQPYTATVRTLLSRQKYSTSDPRPYDDTGWTLDELRHVTTHAVADSQILTMAMEPLTDSATVAGTVAGSGGVLLVEHMGDWRSAVLPWKTGGARVSVAEVAFDAAGRTWPAGTFIVEGGTDAANGAVEALSLTGMRVGSVPAVERHTLKLPRVALMHSWIETQNEGWVRFAFDYIGIPFTYISDQALRRPNGLDRFDVVVFPHVRGSAASILNGRPMTGPPIPWKKTERTPNLGRIDQTDDLRVAMGLEGAAALRRFVERGGLLITTGGSSELPVHLGFNPTVQVVQTPQLQTRGAIMRAQPALEESPILYGYAGSSFPVYFNAEPVMSVSERDTSERMRRMDPKISAEAERMRAKAVLAFHERADSLLVSGMLAGGQELAKKAAVVDAPVGNGHVVLFGIRPFWRWQTQGSFALALNAMANWNNLGVASKDTSGVAAENGQ